MLRIAGRSLAVRRVLVPVAACLCLLIWHAAAAETTAAAPAAAPAPAASGDAQLAPADRAQAEALVKTLQDPAARDKLIAQLKLLSSAGQPAAPPARHIASGLLVAISDALHQASDELLAAAAALSRVEVGDVSDWVKAQIGDPRLRQRWWRVTVRLAAVLVCGLLVEWLIGRLLAMPRRFLDARRPSNAWLRLPLAAARCLIDLFPVGGFAATGLAMLTLPIYVPGGHSELTSVVVITAYATGRAIMAVVRALFRPDDHALRVLPLSDGRAAQAYFWTRRIVLTGVWGYYGDDVLRLLGLPDAGYDFLLKLLGLAVAAMIVMGVFEHRHPVAQWIRSGSWAGRGSVAGRHEIEERVEGARNWLAGAWHILALLYVAAAYLIWATRVNGGFEFLLRASLFTVAIIVVTRLVAGLWQRMVDRAFGVGSQRTMPFPLLAARRRRYYPFARGIGSALIALIAVLAVFQAWGAGTLAWFASDDGHRLLGTIAAIAATVIGALFFWEVITATIERYLAQTDGKGNQIQRSSRARTLLPLVRNALTILIVLVAALIVLGQVGVNIAPLLAGAGVIGVAIGFGSQKLVQDVITGAFILFEDTIAVGDVVTIGDHSGVVEGLTIRTIRLRTASGELHTLPFSSVSTVVNMSRDYAYNVFNIGVSYREDVDRVMQVIRDLGAEMRADPVWGRELAEPVELWGVDKFAESAVILAGRLKTAPGRQWDVGREFNRRIKNRFDELGIEMPYRTTTLYFGEDREGRAPPIRVRMEDAAAAPPARAPAPLEGDAGRIQIAADNTKTA